MRWRNFLFAFLVLLIVVLLLIYFFVPLNTVNLSSPGFFQNSSVYMNNSFGDSNLQFYDNMRYRSNRISYRIDDDCTLQKKNDMQQALDIISNLSVLEFYPAIYGEEITVTCSETNIVQGDTFIGGEGGVTNVTISGDFNVIFNGQILLIRDAQCPTPNIAVHELLHALGFDHSPNPGNIMYETYDCSQTIGDEIPAFINQIYSVPEKPDLVFEDVEAVLHGKYLDANVSLRNNGLTYSPDSTLIISADGKEVKSVDVSSLGIGFGRKIGLTNLWINQINVNEITFTIKGDFEEFSKDNNVYTLAVEK